MLKDGAGWPIGSIRNGLANGGDDVFYHLPVFHAQVAGEGLLDRNPHVIR